MGFLFVRFCSAISQPLRKWLKRLLKRLKPSRNSFISLIAWTYSKDNMCLSLCVWVCVWKKKRKRGDKDLIRHVAERQIDHVYTLWEEKKSWLFIESERGRVRKSKRQGSLTVSTFSFFLVSRIERTRIFFYSPPPSLTSTVGDEITRWDSWKKGERSGGAVGNRSNGPCVGSRSRARLIALSNYHVDGRPCVAVSRGRC